MLKLFIKLAWRNVLRNKRRTLIAGVAIGIGLAALIFTDALIIGMEDNMVASATASFLGEGRIHHENYTEAGGAEWTIENYPQITEELKQEEIVRHFAPRVKALAMVSSARNVQAAMMVGVKPSRERYLSQVDEGIIEGEYFRESSARDIIIGRELADILEAGLGERIVLTVSEAETGELSQELFRVAGIFETGVREMDRSMAFVRLEKARAMLGITGVHEIAIDFTETKYGRDTSLPFWRKYSEGKNIAEGWVELMPELAAVLRLSNFSAYIVGIILFGVVSLGIINTLFMSLHERIFEFGVMRAVGTRPCGVGRLILFEAASLSIISIALGIILSFVILAVTGSTGIDYTGIEFAGVTFRELLYPVIALRQFIVYPFAVFVFTVLAGIYPAVYAAKLKPADALRKTM